MRRQSRVPRRQVQRRREGDERQWPAGQERRPGELGWVDDPQPVRRGDDPERHDDGAQAEHHGEALSQGSAGAGRPGHRDGDAGQREPQHDDAVRVDLERHHERAVDDRRAQGNPAATDREGPAGGGDGRPGEQRGHEGALVGERDRGRGHVAPLTDR